jgi:hypothetical protein
MLKKVISLLVLTMYLHGMSGYTMSFHTCTITGSENVYTGFGTEDPCEEEENDCHETSTHFEQADCCDIQQTFISVEDESDIISYKIPVNPIVLHQTFVQSSVLLNSFSVPRSYQDSYTIGPPDLCSICIFRI